MNEHFFIYNGFLFRRLRPVMAPDHPSFGFGDGIFETMRMHKGKIINSHLHFERLRNGMKILEYNFDNHFFQNIADNISVLVQKNQHGQDARIKLSVGRASDSFMGKDVGADYVIETDSVIAPSFPGDGITAVIYDKSTKGLGELSNLKNKNYLLNILAYRFAQAQGCDEAILLNGSGRVCETSISNIYFVEGGKILTPALAEGCVAGTVRQWLMHHLSFVPIEICEAECPVERLLQADEVFTSNAIRWIRPIRKINSKNYRSSLSREVFELMKQKLL